MESSKHCTALSLASRSAFVNCRYRKGCGGLKLYGDYTVGKRTRGTCEACDQVILSPRREKRTRPHPVPVCVWRSPLKAPSDALCASLVTCGPNPQRHSARRATT
eukprot:scaffold19910_cov70-Phaeocystis_antarctica.AAC.4